MDHQICYRGDLSVIIKMWLRRRVPSLPLRWCPLRAHLLSYHSQYRRKLYSSHKIWSKFVRQFSILVWKFLRTVIQIVGSGTVCNIHIQMTYFTQSYAVLNGCSIVQKIYIKTFCSLQEGSNLAEGWVIIQIPMPWKSVFLIFEPCSLPLTQRYFQLRLL